MAAEIERRINPRQFAKVSHDRYTQLSLQTLNLLSLAGLAIHLLILASIWGQWRLMAINVSTMVVAFPLNIWFNSVKLAKSGPLADYGRNLVNLVVVVVVSRVAGWPLAAWLWLPFMALAFDQMGGRMALVSLVASCVLLDGFGLYDGVPLIYPICFTFLAVFCEEINRVRSGGIREMLGQSDRQRMELEHAHLLVSESLEKMKQMQSAMIQQEKMSSLGILAAGVAHEINNPMGYITANTRCLLTVLKGLPTLPAPLKDYVEEVIPETLDGIARVNQIVGDLRRFARGDPDGYVEYELNREVESAIRICGAGLSGKAEVVFHSASGLPKLLGRPQQITQVLVNLLMNAAQAIEHKGRVEVETHRDGPSLVLSVRDTGNGMPEEVRQKLFQPFFTTKPAGEGTGLGLSVAWGIVKGHGGEISVESKVGVGTCFTITLPLIPPTLRLAAPAAVLEASLPA